MKNFLRTATLILVVVMTGFLNEGYASHISVSGIISSNTTWSGIDTVFITGNITVNNGITLTIQQGIVVVCQGHYKIAVNGRLLAIGTASHEIIFTVTDTTGYHNHSHTGWGGIEYNNTPATNDTSKFVYCSFFYGKSTPDDGAGGAFDIFNFGKIIITHSILAYNYASTFGGAVCTGGTGQVAISYCLIHDNQSDGDGGFFYCSYFWNLRNNIITRNRAASWGGAIFASDAQGNCINNVISDNISNHEGGGLFLQNTSSPVFLNNTICNNQAQSGGGILFENQAADFTNNIFYGNTASLEGSQIYFGNLSYANFQYCNIQGLSSGFGGETFKGTFTNCISLNPEFSGIATHPYSLLKNSPCNNMGNPATTTNQAGNLDAAGNSRIYNGLVDCIEMGAYEFQGDPEPVVIQKYPADQQELIQPGPVLTLTFTTPIIAKTGFINIYKKTSHILFEKIAANSATLVTIESNKVFIDPVNDFTGNTEYYIMIDSLAFSDPLNQCFKGFYTTTDWSFKITSTDPFPGNALDFDGVNNYVEILDNDSLDLTTNYTLEVWIKPGSFGSLKGIISKYQSSGTNGYFLRLTQDSPYTGLNFDGMNTPAGILLADHWYHVAAVNNNGTRKLYLNGVLQALTGTPVTVIANGDPLRIGVDFNSRYFDGEIEEVRIWNKALGVSEIREKMYQALEGTESNLISYWQFNEGNDTLATDKVGHHNGNLKNMTSTNWVLSSIPLGPGVVNTQIIQTPANTIFQGTGLTINFVNHTGQDTVVVTRLDTIPNIKPATVDTVYDAQYWIVDKFGNGTLNATLKFTLSEDLTPQDQFFPDNIRLYGRQSIALDDWAMVAVAASVDAASNTVTFQGITNLSQFIVGRHAGTSPPIVAALIPSAGSIIPSTGIFQMIFDHKVTQVATKSIRIYHACTDALLETFIIPSSRVTGSGTDTIKIVPQNIFQTGEKYYFLIDHGTFINQTGNDFEGFSSPYNWNFHAAAQGHITSHVVWCDTLKVTGDIYIDDGATLEIMPGTNIDILGHYKFDVKGKIVALGTENEKILFSAVSTGKNSKTSATWNRIIFDGTPATNDTSRFTNCTFQNGNASQTHIYDKQGGAMYVYNWSKLQISNCIFQNNNAGTDGGAIYFYNAKATLKNNIFRNNGAQRGGAIFCINNSVLNFVNNVFYSNLGLENGGAFHIMGSSATFLNNTIYNNNTGSPGYGGGIYLWDASPVFRNTIIAGNMVSTTSNQVYLDGGSSSDPNFYYCDIEGGKNAFTGSGSGSNYTGNYENTIDSDPLVLGTGNNPCSLRFTSPCINSGDPATTLAQAGQYDVAGNRRILEARIDIGSYETNIHGDTFAGNALQFDGIDDYVDLTNVTGYPFGQSFTVEAWVKMERMSSGFHTIAVKGNEWIIKVFLDPVTAIIEFGINHNSVFVTYITHPDSLYGKWHHISCSNGPTPGYNTMTIFLDGIQGTTHTAQTVVTGSDPVRIGQSFKGVIDELRIWNTVQTDYFVRENMNLVLPGSESGLKTYMQFNEISGTTTRDISGGNFGTLYNMSDPACWINSTIVAGKGFSATQVVSGTGTVAFPTTGITMNFTNKLGTDNFVVTRIDTIPNITPGGLTEVFNKQYWVIKKFGTGTFSANVSFAPLEDLTLKDSVSPWLIKLSKRSSNAEGVWTNTETANSVGALANTATFNNFTAFSQFILGRGPGDTENFPGKALDFSGSGSYISGSGIDANLSSFTIEAWVYHNSLSTTVQRYVSVSPEVAVIRHDGTAYGGYHQLHFYIKKADGSGYGLRVDSVMNTGEWMHVAGTFDGQNMHLYLNGKLLKSATVVSELFPPDGNFTFSHSNEKLDGKMDEVRIWKYARTAQQIRENMYLKLSGTENGLLSYWQMNDASGIIASDNISGNSGNLHNMNNSAWVASAVPFGDGNSNTQVVGASGYIDFPGTGIAVNFASKTGTDEIVATRIDTVANIPPTGTNNVFDKQYFIINKFGNGTFTGDIYFTVKEYISTADFNNPSNLHLYARGSNSDAGWTMIKTAVLADTGSHIVKFSGITGFGQFMLTGKLHPDNIAGTALSFNGENEDISFDPLYNTSPTALTVEAWVYPVNLSASISYLLYHGDNGEFGLLVNENTPGFQVKLSDQNWYNLQSSALELNTWQHLCGVWDSEGSLKIYLNGELLGSSTIPALPLFDPGSGYLPSIGAKNRNSYFFNGKLDEIRVWNKVRTTTEIRESIYATLDGTEDGLVDYWQFNDGSGASAIDVAGRGTGALINMDNSNWVLSTAPLPFKSNADGNWSAASTWDSGQGIPVKDWSRVEIINAVILDADKTLIDLSVDAAASLVIASTSHLTVTGNLMNAAGNPGLQLKSEASATASIIHETANVDATVERYIPQYVGAAGWHFLASPVAAQNIRPEFVNSGTPNPDNDFYKFDEPTYYWINTKLVSGEWNTAFENNFVIGRGYIVAYKTSGTKAFQGKLNTGNFTFNGTSTPVITYTEETGKGWNLLGNPFPSALDWDEFTKTNINGSAYVYDGVAGQYVSWNGTIGDLTDGIIPPMNGFFIKAATGASLTIPNTSRKHTSINFYKEKDFIENLLVLKVEGNGFSDKTYLHFRDDATLGFDNDFDAYKLFGIEEAPQLYTTVDEEILSINSLPFNNEKISIPLNLRVGKEDLYKISVAENTFWETVEVSLKDLMTGIVYDLRQQTSITVNHSPESQRARFLFFINGATSVGEISGEDDSIEIYYYNHQIFIKSEKLEILQVSVYNLLGQNLTGFPNLSGLTPGQPIQLDFTGSPGFYLVKVKTVNGTKFEKIYIR